MGYPTQFSGSRLKGALADLKRIEPLFKKFIESIADQDAVHEAEQFESSSHYA